MLVDDKTAICNQKAFDELGEYSFSLPTGTIVGKRWKCNRDWYTPGAEDWVMGEYAECDPPDPKRVRIIWRKLVVV